MPERFECITLAKKRHIDTLPFLTFLTHSPWTRASFWMAVSAVSRCTGVIFDTRVHGPWTRIVCTELNSECRYLYRASSAPCRSFLEYS